MGGKSIKGIKIINYASNKETSIDPRKAIGYERVERVVEKMSPSGSKSSKSINVQNLISTGIVRELPANKSILQKNTMVNVSPSKTQKKYSNKDEIDRINLNVDVELSPNTPGSPKKTTIKKPKKSEVAASNEINILKVIKKHNKEFDDAKLIDNCLTRHFFMRALDRNSR
jgi:hypothetical protein